jgi:TP901 family phage tail tape measure protein
MALKLGELVTYLRADDTALTRGLATAQEKLQAAGERARQYAPVIGGAIAAGIGAGLVSALETDKAKAKLAAQLGGDAQYAADMGKIAGHVYARGFGQSLEEVNETLRGVLGSGLIDEDATNAEIESVTVKAQALADVFGQDVTQTARAAGQMVRTGLAKDSAEAFDIITRGFQQTGDQAGDLLDTFSEYSTQFRKLGLDGTTATGLLSQGLKAGARDLDIVADALKEFSIRAVDGSKSTSEGFKALGLDAAAMGTQIGKGGESAKAGLDTVLDKLREIDDPVKRSQVAVQLFGTQAEDLGDALFALDPSKAAKGLGDVAGAADKLGQTVEQSASQKLEAFKRKAQEALVAKLSEAIPVIESTFGWLQKNSGWVEPLAIGLGVLAVAIGGIVLATKIWTAVQTALNVVMAMNPLGLLIIGIGLIVAGILLLWNNSSGFRDFWIGAWEKIKGAASAVWNWVKSNWPLLLAILTGPIGLAVLAIVKNWDKIKAGATAVKDWTVTKFSQLVSWLTGLPGRISNSLSSMWDGLKSGFRAAINWVIGKWNGLSFGIPGFSIAGVSVPGVNVGTPDIPYLAKGGVVTRPTMAMVGEGREHEAVAPLSKLTGMIRDAVQSVIGTGNTEPMEVHVHIGERELTEIVDVRIKHNNRRTARAAGPRTLAAAR